MMLHHITSHYIPLHQNTFHYITRTHSITSPNIEEEHIMKVCLRGTCTPVEYQTLSPPATYDRARRCSTGDVSARHTNPACSSMTANSHNVRSSRGTVSRIENTGADESMISAHSNCFMAISVSLKPRSLACPIATSERCPDWSNEDQTGIAGSSAAMER